MCCTAECDHHTNPPESTHIVGCVCYLQAKTALSEGSMEMYNDDERKVSDYDVSVLIAGLGLVKTSKMLVKKCLKTFQVSL